MPSAAVRWLLSRRDALELELVHVGALIEGLPCEACKQPICTANPPGCVFCDALTCEHCIQRTASHQCLCPNHALPEGAVCGYCKAPATCYETSPPNWGPWCGRNGCWSPSTRREVYGEGAPVPANYKAPAGRQPCA